MQTVVKTSPTRRWWILATVLIGSLVGTTGNSMMNVALPSILEDYRAGLDSGVWIVTIYVLLFSTLMPICGRLGDMFGYRRIYLVGMATLAVWSAAAAFAPNLGWLIALRALAGISNAPTLPAVMAIIATTFPANERGGALGFWATVNAASHGAGPVLSGLLVQSFGWPAVFWFNAAVALIGVVMIAACLPSDSRRSREHFDLVGASTLTGAMILMLFNLTVGLNGSVSLEMNLLLWGACAGLLAAFGFSQARLPHPFVDLRLLTRRAYAAVTLVSGAQLFCLFGLQLLLPQFLRGVQGRSFAETGLLVAPLALTLAVVSPLAGRLADTVGGRLTCALGMGLVAAAGAGMLFWTAATPVLPLVLTLMALGFGMGLTQSPTASLVTLVVEKDRLGVALGIFNMLRFVMGTLGATIFGVILERGSQIASETLAAFRLDFGLFIAAAAAAALLALTLPAPRAHQTATVEP